MIRPRLALLLLTMKVLSIFAGTAEVSHSATARMTVIARDSVRETLINV